MASGPSGRFGLLALLETLPTVPGVVGAVLSTEEGLPLAARVREDQDEEALAAAATVLGQLGTRASADSKLGPLKLLCLDASRLRFIVRPVSLGHLLVLVDYSADFEQVLTAMQGTVAELETAAQAIENSFAA